MRVFLRRGATSAEIAGHLEPHESQAFVLRAARVQPMLLRLDSAQGDADLSIMTQGGTFLLRPGLHQSWRGSLPRTEDYYIGVYGGAAPQDFTLYIQLATRITFKEGAAAAAVGGKTVDGTVAVYSVLGQKDERMVVSLSRAGQNASLGVSGFVDGERYLASTEDKTIFMLELPMTQDYIIEVVPAPGKTVSFVLDVEIK
jgi:hypothetical protein